MASVLETIYDNVASWTVTVGGKTAKVRNLDSVREELGVGDTPVRMMLVTSGDTEVGSSEFVAMGKVLTITWILEDRLYWKPIAEGQGLADYNGDLMRYCVQYLEQYRQNRGLGSSVKQAHLLNCRAVPAIVRYPDVEDGIPYAGVRCILEIEEVVSGA